MKDEDPRRWRPSAEGKRLAQMRMAGFDGKGNTRTSMAMKLPPRGQIIPQKPSDIARGRPLEPMAGRGQPSPPLRTGTNGDPNLLIVSEALRQQYATILQIAEAVGTSRLSPAPAASPAAGGGAAAASAINESNAAELAHLRAKERETGDMLDNLRAENENLRQHVLQARARAIRRRNSTAQFGARRNSL